MNLIGVSEPDCVSLDDRLKRLPRKQLKFWLELLDSSPNAYCDIFIKYGSILSLPDGLTENTYYGWTMFSDTTLLSNIKYTGYVVNSYNLYLNEILEKFGVFIKLNLIPQLNYLLTNINKYRHEDKTIEDIQIAIWKLLKKKV